jgi:hypothetical protein
VDQVRNEYEVCFKCHGDSANQPPLRPGAPLRAFRETNLREALRGNAASFHPVVEPGRSADVPSLLPGLSEASFVRCTDCHASDAGPGVGGTGPAGPHGSIFPFLLERQYLTGDAAPENPESYALCYKCHDRQVLLDPARSGFPLHALHVADRQTTCSTCHTPHGVSWRAGNPTNNAHLIDFDVAVVEPNASGLHRYETSGLRSGSCALICHAHVHDPTAAEPTGVYGPVSGLTAPFRARLRPASGASR